MWSFRDVDWTLPGFLLVLTGPAIYYFNASVLIPEAPASIESWRVHYFSVRKRYWLAICLWSLLTSIGNFTLLGIPIVHPARFFQLFLVVLGVTGIVSAKPRVHAILAIILTCLLPFGAFIFLSLPGSLAQWRAPD
jgi:hypothetical protein